MKLTDSQTKTLIEVLNAQTRVKPIVDKDEYKQKLSEVKAFLASVEVVDKERNPKTYFTGGIKKEVYRDNKENTELVEAAKKHLDMGREREARSKEKTRQNNTPQQNKTTPSPEDLAQRGEEIVKYLQAKTVYLTSKKTVKTLPRGEALTLGNKVNPLLDREKGGLSNAHWEVFKKYPGVKEACVAHQKAYQAELANPTPDPNRAKNEETLSDVVQNIAVEPAVEPTVEEAVAAAKEAVAAKKTKKPKSKETQTPKPAEKNAEPKPKEKGKAPKKPTDAKPTEEKNNDIPFD